MNTKLEEFFSEAEKWKDELIKLRTIVLDCGLSEEFKWQQPCYLYGKTNILIIHGFKEYCALNFFNGALLKDELGIMVKPGENTQAGRQIRFTNIRDIIEMEPILKSYIFEIVEAEKAGLKVEMKKTEDYPVPDELKNKFKEMPKLKSAFDALTPGRQRAYLLHFSAPKQSQTRESRIENYIPRILAGKGVTDCICGFTKHPPNCDGSHKHIEEK